MQALSDFGKYSEMDGLDSSRNDARGKLSEQLRHQVRITRRWMTWWIPAIFAVGLGVCIVGLIPAVTASVERGSPRISVFVYGLFTVFFGWAVIYSVIWPLLVRPRIVPYFRQELEPYGGSTMAAFFRGRALYREILALEEVAASLGVAPLSAFGFSHDLYGQEVSWHAPSDGLRTVEALRQDAGTRSNAPPAVVQDLEALISILRVAAARNVEFSLVLRLHAKDSMQGVCTRELRQGSYW